MGAMPTWVTVWSEAIPDAPPRNLADVVADALARTYSDYARHSVDGGHKGQPLTVQVPPDVDHGAWLTEYARLNS